MSWSDCARCWSTPCYCPGSAMELALVLQRYGFKFADASQDGSEAKRLEEVLKAAGLREVAK